MERLVWVLIYFEFPSLKAIARNANLLQSDRIGVISGLQLSIYNGKSRWTTERRWESTAEASDPINRITFKNFVNLSDEKKLAT